MLAIVRPGYACVCQASLLVLQEKCIAAGMDYDEVVSQAVVWEGAVPAAGDTASAAAVTQDTDDKPSGEQWHQSLQVVMGVCTGPQLSLILADNAGDAPEPLPEGWSEAKDQQQRTYYWHTTTKKVQWERPTAATPA